MKNPQIKNESQGDVSRRARRNRSKGRRFEQAVARSFRAVFGEKVKPGLQGQLKLKGPEVENAGTWWVEAKARRKVSFYAAYVEAEFDSMTSGLKPLVVGKNDGEIPLAVLSFEHFLDLLVELETLRARVAGKKAPNVR